MKHIIFDGVTSAKPKCFSGIRIHTPEPYLFNCSAFFFFISRPFHYLLMTRTATVSIWKESGWMMIQIQTIWNTGVFPNSNTRLIQALYRASEIAQENLKEMKLWITMMSKTELLFQETKCQSDFQFLDNNNVSIYETKITISSRINEIFFLLNFMLSITWTWGFVFLARLSEISH